METLDAVMDDEARAPAASSDEDGLRKPRRSLSLSIRLMKSYLFGEDTGSTSPNKPETKNMRTTDADCESVLLSAEARGDGTDNIDHAAYEEYVGRKEGPVALAKIREVKKKVHNIIEQTKNMVVLPEALRTYLEMHKSVASGCGDAITTRSVTSHTRMQLPRANEDNSRGNVLSSPVRDRVVPSLLRASPLTGDGQKTTALQRLWMQHDDNLQQAMADLAVSKSERGVVPRDRRAEVERLREEVRRAHRESTTQLGELASLRRELSSLRHALAAYQTVFAETRDQVDEVLRQISRIPTAREGSANTGDLSVDSSVSLTTQRSMTMAVARDDTA